MHFGEQVTQGGIILGNDDGKTRGIYPRWAKVFSKGPENKDEYSICLLYTSPSPRDRQKSRMPSSA